MIAENQLVLRQLEHRGQFHRVLSVVKMRFSDHDRAMHEVTITPRQGVQVLAAPLAEALLRGTRADLAESTGQGE